MDGGDILIQDHLRGVGGMRSRVPILAQAECVVEGLGYREVFWRRDHIQEERR